MIRTVMALTAAAVAVIFTCAATAGEIEGESLLHPTNGALYSGFGFRTHPLLGTVRLHNGVDYRGKIGDPVFAAKEGTIEEAQGEGGYGNYVRIDHGGGLKTSYAHLDMIMVTRGQHVAKGAMIGTIGATGISSEPHLHFEIIRDGRFMDPAELLPKRS